MLNKNVCPNCGQLYDTNLSKCPLCGTAPQVVDTADPVQRKRITEAERRQRRASRKEAEQEARRRRKDAQLMQDADEERLLEEEEARRREEKRRLKEEKKASRRAEQSPEENPLPPEQGEPAFTPGPAVDGRGPMPKPHTPRDPKRVPRVLLGLSALVLLAALVVGGGYLLWKLELLPLPIFDKLAAEHRTETAAPDSAQLPADSGAAQTEDPAQSRTPEGESVPCTGITLGQTEIRFTAAGEQLQIPVTLSPENTTDERVFSTTDPGVAKVSSVGLVTAAGPGSAMITVTCGGQSAVCSVSCDFETNANSSSDVSATELVLNKTDMTFFAAGENYALSVTNLPAGTAVEWKSLDEAVCTVNANGHVTAVGVGTTRVIASVGELSADCWVRCRFE